jgi:hypothetical protein
MSVIERWSGFLAIVILASVPFSSCTCQRDLPEPPAKTAKSSRDAWSGLPTPRAAKRASERGDLPKAVQSPGENPTVLPTQPEKVELPDDFPSGVPIVDGAELFGVQAVGRGGKNVLFHTDEQIPQVFDFYKSSMRGEGWNVKQEFQQSYQSFLSFEKDKTITNMTVVEDPATGKRIIAVMYYEQEELPFPEF